MGDVTPAERLRAAAEKIREAVALEDRPTVKWCGSRLGGRDHPVGHRRDVGQVSYVLEAVCA